MAKGCLKRMESGIAHSLLGRVSPKRRYSVARAIQSGEQTRAGKGSDPGIAWGGNARRQNEWSAVLVVWAANMAARRQIQIARVVEEKAKILVAGIVIHINDELVCHRSNVPQAEDGIRAQLPLYREIQMLRVGQAVGMPERDFRVAVQRFKRREIKCGVRILAGCVAGHSKRKHLPIGTCHPIDIRSLEELLPSGRPEQSKRNVSDLLELAQVLECRIENSATRTNARFSRSSRQFRKEAFGSVGGPGQAETR